MVFTIPAFNNLSTTNLNDFAPLRFAIRNALDLGPRGFSLAIHCHTGLLDEREHLRWLLKEFHFETALLLIEQWKVSEGVDFSNCDINGLTPLMSACWSGNEHIVRSILQGAGTEHVNKIAKNGQTALHIAAAVGIEPIVSALIDTGALDDFYGKILDTILAKKMEMTIAPCHEPGDVHSHM